MGESTPSLPENRVATRLKRRWLAYVQGSTDRKIFGAAVTIAVLTVLVNVASVGKELVVAWQFGTGDALDAFLIAWLLPSFLINVVAGSLNASLVPTYIRVREQEGPAAAQRLFSNVMIWTLGLLAATMVLMVVAAPLYLPLLASGFGPEKLDLTRHLLYVIAPIVILSGLVTIGGAILNADERFVFAALTPIVTPVAAMLFLLIGGSIWGIFALAVGTVCGGALEATLLGTALRRQGISLRPSWHGFDAHVRQVAGQYVPMVAGACLMSSTSLVDQAMAAMLESGNVAALNYGGKVIALPLGVVVTALGTAVIPYFSGMVARRDWADLQHTLSHYLRSIFLTTVPLTILLILISKPLVQVLFQRGSFTSEDTYIVACVQALYALQIPFYVAGILVVRLISSMCANHILMWGAVINLTVNVCLNYFFMKLIGVAGIALSTSCVYLISFSFLFYYCQRLLKEC